ncbi:MAG: HAMP domain-containing sensor histidine kinase [Burkholderiaceae bacterium]|nr:HAMP domain-containing sensor histidine kinase [Burkholderiaceae bacterium]
MMVLSSAAPPAACTPVAAPALGDATDARLLAMVAHELRKPLSPIAIAASLLREAAGDARKLSHLQSVIEQQVEQLTRVIADLTDTTWVRTGSLSIERRTIVATAFVRQAADACRASLASRGQRLVLRLPQRPFRLHADPGRLVQILTNLIDNASKFSERGTSIVVSLAVGSGTSELAVEDAGIGIAPESLATLFDASAQQARRIRPRGAGMGLGLSIVRVLAEAHGGSVRATSAGEGRGTRFVVRLPNEAPAWVSLERSSQGAHGRQDGRGRGPILHDDPADYGPVAEDHPPITHTRPSRAGPSTTPSASTIQPYALPGGSAAPRTSRAAAPPLRRRRAAPWHAG